MLVRVANKDSETVIDALIKQAHKLPRELYKSLTKWGAKKMPRGSMNLPLVGEWAVTRSSLRYESGDVLRNVLSGRLHRVAALCTGERRVGGDFGGRQRGRDRRRIVHGRRNRAQPCDHVKRGARLPFN